MNVDLLINNNSVFLAQQCRIANPLLARMSSMAGSACGAAPCYLPPDYLHSSKYLRLGSNVVYKGKGEREREREREPERDRERDRYREKDRERQI